LNSEYLDVKLGDIEKNTGTIKLKKELLENGISNDTKKDQSPQTQTAQNDI